MIHADYVNYEVETRGKFAEEITPDRKEGSLEDPLIAFVSIEENDENSGTESGDLVEKAFREIRKVASKIKVRNVALFPFAHLSESLSSPDFAVSVLKDLEDRFKKSKFNSFRAPFGWYKEFEFRSKGHPLSILSRTVRLN
ncbi:hypothetical protein AKJ41_01195 [candidate division MSBL1 archaeon SCGC-AAA259O05]|uniref:Threonyl-tRNA synthetase editing domain-containing protein n=1 Tax=candidate division MSBL1 archaeon SCGC-AAA259O05 TaxID=1698271 RepID=A0A133V529_9EURY|nr:hypothetical protein AKJ41_01195 [candidate division MSBL1 archaeon SCGC-AAA259O05]